MLKTYFSCSVFPDDPNSMFQNIPNEKVVLLPGICFSIDSNQAGLNIIRKLRPDVEPKGYRLFLCDGPKEKDRIAIVRCDDEFLLGLVEVDEFVVGGQEKKAQGRSLGKKPLAW